MYAYGQNPTVDENGVITHLMLMGDPLLIGHLGCQAASHSRYYSEIRWYDSLKSYYLICDNPN